MISAETARKKEPAERQPVRRGARRMTARAPVVFLVDVDNTLVDNDCLQEDLKDYIERDFGAECRDRYWTIVVDLFTELGYRDYIGALQRLRVETPLQMELLSMSSFLLDYPFADRLYPGALEVLKRLRRWGPTVILTDGDVVFQPRKVERSGIFGVVDGEVLIYIHKEEALDDVERRYPADHYVLVDDKLRILAAVKAAWGERVTTVLPRQGQFALDQKVLAALPPADVTIDRIGDLLRYELSGLLPGATRVHITFGGCKMKATQKLHDLGQSLWLDNITRDLLNSGTLKRYIDELSVTGLTSNPTIFDHAIKNSATYDDRDPPEGEGGPYGRGPVLRPGAGGSDPGRRPVPADLRPHQRRRRLGLARGLAAAGP